MHRTRSDQRAEPGPGLSVELQGVMDLVVATQRSLEGTQKHSGVNPAKASLQSAHNSTEINFNETDSSSKFSHVFHITSNLLGPL